MKRKEFPIAICVMSDSGETCKGWDCPIDVRKCYPNYKIPKKSK